jgi:glycosyltransferase involved in cell wall biosynthesis
MSVWNGERDVIEAATSVLEQLGDDDELVVVDDGSTDRTVELLTSLGDRIRLLTAPHRGVSAARNTSVATCRGRYQGFIDADDRWAPGALTTLIEALEADPDADVVVGLADEFLDEALTHTPGVELRDPVQGARGWFLGTMLGRREVFDRVRFDEDQPMASTTDWLARARAAGVRFRPVDRVVLDRRLRHDSMTANADDYRSALIHALRANLARARSPR